jgi:hypothetical protein
MHRSLFCFSFACTLLLAAAPARSTQLIPRTLSELAAGAPLIFVGRCESVSCHWNDDRSLILTAYRFRVLRALKGDPGTTITLDEIGGRLGDLGLSVPSIPSYAVGEEVLLFVHRTELGRWETFGAVQGKFSLTRDRDGRPWVENNLYRAELATMAPAGSSETGAPLDRFVARLQTVTRTEGARR